MCLVFLNFALSSKHLKQSKMITKLRLWSFVFFGAILACVTTCQDIEFVTENRESIYEYEGSVSVIAQAPWDQIHLKPPQTAGWKIRGTVKLQRPNKQTLAASLAVEKITVDKQNGNAAVFYQNKEMQTLYNPFKVVYINNTIDHIQFKMSDSLWSRNFKRAIASVFQLKNLKNGAFVQEEPGIHGTCSVEYYVTTKSNGHLSIRKNPVMYTCVPHTCGIHSHRSNVPETKCFDGESEKNVIVGNEAMYDFVQRDDNQSNSTNSFDNYYLYRVNVEGNTMLQTFESTGETQLLVSKLMLTFATSNDIVNAIDVDTNMAAEKSNLIIQEHSISDVTGERQTFESGELVRRAIDLLGSLADSLEIGHIHFDEPYEHRVVEVISYFIRCNFDSLKSLYQSINVGTSYRQETMRNLFYDIIPRTGTRASVLLTRDLITENLCKPTTAIQLLISLPFHITEMSTDLISDCEPLMWLSIERPDIRQLGILSFATIVHNAFASGKLAETSFDKYVRTYFDLFLESHDYENKLLYLQALGNLKLGKVPDYLDPIIRDELQSDDVRFMATWIKESVAERSTSSERRTNYETFWPIFENRSAPIELRVAAFMTLLTSNPTSARLMSIHTLMENETNPHLVNFYRTTLLSLAGTTQPCYQQLRRLASSMIRHLPKAPAKRYWVTGNYIFDYRSSEYGLGASLQTLLIGNGKTHLPQIAFFKLRQEAMGKYTNELTLYIKARGLDHVPFGSIVQNGAEINLNKLRTILSSLKMPTVTKSPVHLEIIVQVEGKNILFFFLNQQSFNALTEGDMLNRIMKLLHMDSHINLQNLRWPFHSRYSVPTVLGTPTSLTVQSTVISSLRGNITQDILAIEIERSHEIDLRYSSFTTVSSQSYNPFLNMEHSINREQGFLIYLPINNAVKLNLAQSSLWFSFYRPNNLTSGISLKSRIRSITRGRPLRNSEQPYTDIAVYEGDPNLIASKLISYEIEDLGLMITGVSHPFDIMSHMKLMFHMEPSINTFVYHEMEPLMKLWSLMRVNDIHIGTNKKFTLLFHNTRNTKLEGRVKIVSEVSDLDKTESVRTNTVDLTFEHKSDEIVLHKLSVVFIVQANKAVTRNKKSDQIKLQLAVIHTNKNQQLWMLTSEATYEPIVFLKQPYLLQGSVSFGNKNETSQMVLDHPTEINFDVFADVLKSAKGTFDRLSDSKHCPREVLKFSPPPQNELCDQSVYRDLTTLHDYGINITFHNNPKWLEDTLTRLDYFMTSLSTHTDLYKFNDKIDAEINTFAEKLQLTASLNGKNVTVPNLPLWINKHLDAKFDRPEQLAFSFGYTHMCSLITSTVNTFDDKLIELEKMIKPNCSVLLVADCSITPRFAVFVIPAKGDNDIESYALEMRIEDHTVQYSPRKDGNDFIRVDNSTEIEVTSLMNPLGEGVEFNVYVNAENLLIFELFRSIQIQYRRGNILTIQVSSSIKANLCGVCSLPFNAASDYNYCNVLEGNV